ncbi:hypothetical protein RQM47_09675 [Rubrivirga sp. S365]|uniref:Uncharacterized protein n=1 Tax=Rubrivirga litoralis TaxID=3075598 RepID=A0ABU3BUV5_9BACT|nr:MULTISPECIES: hypothetical protein [unclassified Rubrivirga]MDT0633076.1 hypothetical protein [Rubrivirga sp. F394]MDT7856908.1 hypothetical protein [Rubrivirga sp. S365]
MRYLLALFAAAALAGCSLAGDDYDDYLDDRARLVADLDRLIGAAEADAPGACRVVAVGAKACGGPADYRVYSTAADAEAVERVAAEITTLDEDANRRFELISDCSVPPEPRPALVGGRCVAAE